MTEHGSHHPSIGDLFWAVPNFFIFVGVLLYFLRGPMREYFRARTFRLREALQAGARARAEAAAVRAELAQAVANLPALRAQLLADVRAAAEVERENLIAIGRRAADRIRDDARLLSEHEVARALQTLRAEAIEEAVREATALIRRALRPEDQERFVREFVATAGAVS